ncbi:tetraspanin-9 [Clupea harengus]|uniref:Tetraspanin n=1 Tax=Clupea harengus TaxID=7950 RepID=A0A6P3VV32_CLUHA|nr:tetraspanin-9 [Clupea harengus]
MTVTRRCLCCVKYLMFIFNLIFWLGGCGLFGVGVWLSFKQAEISSLPLSFPSLSAANLLLVAGGITMVTGFLGCLGALKEQRCLLMTFFVILLILVLTEVIMAVTVHIYKEELDKKAQNNLLEGMKDYLTDERLQLSWDSVQKMFKCCGVINQTDWYPVLSIDGKPTLPASCCLSGQECGRGWDEPCYQKARTWLLGNITSVLVFGICIVIVQLLALVFSMMMYCQIRRAEKYLD